MDTAITNLQGSDNAVTGGIASNDLIYGGDAGLWTEAAYGLKARYLMHTLALSTNKATDLDSIISYTQNSFQSAAEELAFNQYDGNSNVNPLAAFVESRVDLGLSQSLATKFQTLNDPRGDIVFGGGWNHSYQIWDGTVLSVNDAIAKGVPNGKPQQGQMNYPPSIVDFAYSAPTEILSYHEVLFLEAEAMVRSGDNTDAQTVLQAAIEDAFTDLNNTVNISSEETWGFQLSQGLDADSYFTAYVLPRFNANPLQEVMLQKYLAFYGAAGEAVEAYNDYRRLLSRGENSFSGTSYVSLANALNAQGKYPYRFAYGNSDVTTNTNVYNAYGDGSYVYKNTDNDVWWSATPNWTVK